MRPSLKYHSCDASVLDGRKMNKWEAFTTLRFILVNVTAPESLNIFNFLKLEAQGLLRFSLAPPQSLRENIKYYFLLFAIQAGRRFQDAFLKAFSLSPLAPPAAASISP